MVHGLPCPIELLTHAGKLVLREKSVKIARGDSFLHEL